MNSNITPLVGIASLFLSGLVGMKIFNWFLGMPFESIPTIGYWHAIGLYVLVNFFVFSVTDKKTLFDLFNYDKTELSFVTFCIAGMDILRMLSALFTAWIIHLIM